MSQQNNKGSDHGKTEGVHTDGDGLLILHDLASLKSTPTPKAPPAKSPASSPPPPPPPPKKGN